MAKNSGVKSEQLTELAEQQVQQWSIGLDAIEQLDADHPSAVLEQEIKPFIAISHELGSGAPQIIDIIKEKLPFNVVDQALLDYLADRYKLSREMLEIVDEKVCHWLVETVGIWLSQRMISQSAYMSLLARFVLMAARSANTIFLGRGVRFILPREKGLAVRIVAPIEQRIERIMHVQQLNMREAKQFAAKRDAEQRQFIQHHFHRDLTDPHQYDLVINTEHFSVDDAAKMILRIWRKRFDGSTAVDNTDS